MKQLVEQRNSDEIVLTIYPKGIIERIKLLFCKGIILCIDLTIDSDNGFVASEQKLITK